VYGLGADAFDAAAIAKIYAAKNRPGDNPLIAQGGSIDQIAQLSLGIPPHAQKLIDSFFPGPLTVVLRKSERVPLLATAGLETIGVRMPRHGLAKDFLAACDVPVVAPSANLSGRPSPTTWQAVLEDLDGRVDCILQAEASEIGLESTVVDCSSAPPTMLRKGAVSLESLRAIVPEMRSVDLADADNPRSPGLKHKHYSPRADVVVVSEEMEFSPTDADAFIGLRPIASTIRMSRICNSIEEYAAELFEFFRECDRAGIRTIFCQAVEENGIGAALMDRIRRASQG
ncbi:MAG TPA: L-threonylcarbamoyladenylate synthase, partial [Pyrinomonadaceae bacterium]|nr:L-threonylcarbamoyladenylate synthase [Pyrinomonadaceae bacterium]